MQRSAAGTEPFTPHLIDGLTEVVGCEYARYKEIDFARRVEIAHVPCSAELDVFGGDPVEMTEADWNAVPSDPCYRATFSEPTGIFIASDLAARSAVSSGASERWQAEFDRWDLRDRMWIQIDGPPWAGIVFDARDRSFGDRDRELARMLQPHLGEIWRNASVRRRLGAALSALDHEQSHRRAPPGRGGKGRVRLRIRAADPDRPFRYATSEAFRTVSPSGGGKSTNGSSARPTIRRSSSRLPRMVPRCSSASGRRASRR